MDSAFGMSAAGVFINLRRQQNAEWQFVASGYTGTDGRLAGWSEQQLQVGTYQLEVGIDGYYSTMGVVPLNLSAIVEFRSFDPTADLHVEIIMTTSLLQVSQQIRGSAELPRP